MAYRVDLIRDGRGRPRPVMRRIPDEQANAPTAARLPFVQPGPAGQPNGPVTRAGFYAPGGGRTQYQGVGDRARLDYVLRAPESRRGFAAAYYDYRHPQAPPRSTEQIVGSLPVEQQGQAFGLPRESQDPNVAYESTVRGGFEQFMGSPLGRIAVGAGAGALGGLAFGPPGIIGGAVVGGGLAYGVGEYQEREVARLAAAYGLAEAQRRFDEENIIGRLLHGLDVPRQWVEQGVGTAGQVGGAALNPDEYGSLDEVLGDLRSTWEAARLTYESNESFANLPPAAYDLLTGRPVRSWTRGLQVPLLGPLLTFNPQTGRIETGFDEREVFVDYDVPEVTGGLSVLVEARRRIANGDDPQQVYAEIQGRYGAPGQVRELVSGLVADPLNYVGEAVELGAAPAARLAGATDVARALEQGRGLAGAAGAYRNIQVTRALREGVEAGRELNAVQRLLVGRDVIRLADQGTYTPPRAFELWRLTPESMAREHVYTAVDHLQAQLAHLPLDETYPERAAALVQALKQADPDRLAADFPEAARLATSLEGRVVRRSLNAEAARDLGNVWQATAPERQLLDDVARAVGDTPEGVLARVGAGEGEALLQQLRAAAGSLEGGAELVAKIDDGSLTPAVLEAAQKLFKQDGVPYTPEMARAALASQLAEGASKWAVDTFQIRSPGFIEKMAAAVKGIESVALLGLNLTYPIRNFTNGEITMAARGAWGLHSVRSMLGELERMGLSPARLQAGVGGAAGLGDELADAARLGLGGEAAQAGLRAIEEATAYEGLLADIRTIASRITSELPPTKAAQRIERWQSARALYEGFRQGWSQTWRRGKGFARMPAALEASLAEIDPRLPGAIYAATEAGYSPGEIAARVQALVGEPAGAPRGWTAPVAQEFASEVAQAAGVDEDTVHRLLAQDGLGDFLNKELAGLPEGAGRSEVSRVFRGVRERAERALDSLAAEEVGVRAEHAARVVEVEGPGGLLRVMDDLEDELFQAYQNHTRALELEWDEVRRAGRYRGTLFAKMRERADGTFRRYFTREEATYAALEEGLGKAGLRLDEDFLPAVRRKREAIGQFHAQKNALLDRFFNGQHGDDVARAAAWRQTLGEIDQAYAALIAEQTRLQARVDDYLVAVYRRDVGEETGLRVDAWRRRLRELTQADMEGQQAFRASLATLDPEQRNVAWRSYFEQRLQARRAAGEEGLRLRRQVVAPQLEQALAEAKPSPALAEAARPAAETVPQAPEQPVTISVAQAQETAARARARVQTLRAQARVEEPLGVGPLSAALEDAQRTSKAAGMRLAAERRLALRVRELLATEPDVTAAQVKRQLKVGLGDAERVLGEVRAGLPEGAEPAIPERVIASPQITPEQAGQVRAGLEAERAAEGLRAQTPGLSLGDVVNQPRSSLPENIRANLEYAARDMLEALTQGEPGKRLFNYDVEGQGGTPQVVGIASSYPDWYGPFLEQYKTNRRAVLTALEKIVEDAGRDRGKMVGRLKRVILEELAEGILGQPPDPDALRLLGRSADEITAAEVQWADLTGEIPDQEVDYIPAPPQPDVNVADLMFGAPPAAPVQAAPAPQRAPAAARAMDLRATALDPGALKEYGWDRGLMGAFYALNYDRRSVRLPAYASLSDVPFDEMVALINRRVAPQRTVELLDYYFSPGRMDEILTWQPGADQAEYWQRIVSNYPGEAAWPGEMTWNGPRGRSELHVGSGTLLGGEVRARFEAAGWREERAGLWVKGAGGAAAEIAETGATAQVPLMEAQAPEPEGVAIRLNGGEEVHVLDVDLEGLAHVREAGAVETRTVEAGVENEFLGLPPDALDDVAGGKPAPLAQAQEEAWYSHMLPVLEELQKRTEDSVARGPLAGAGGVPADVADGVRRWLDEAVRPGMATSKREAVRWGEFKRDASLLNYSRRYQFNHYLGLVAPYEFWMTNSMIQWALGSLDKPGLLASYYRINRFLNTEVQKPGFPSRLTGRVRVPLPFLPEWMGGGVWVDPLSAALPLEGWAWPWDDFQNRSSNLQYRAERALADLLDAGQITLQQHDAALAELEESGAGQLGVGGLGLADETARRAVQLALSADSNLRFDAADLATLLVSPHLPLSWAYQYLRGTPERISPLPGTRQVRALTAAVGLGGPGGFNLEGGLRRQLGLPIFDQWEDYRVDRELANMAADGSLTADQARAAMIEREGEAFEQAQRRAALHSTASVLTSLATGATGGLYPEGEERQRALALLNRAAWEAEENGDTEALADFYDEFPEYAARLALNDGPEERLQKFLTGQVWAGWNVLPTLYQRELRAQLGEEFEQAFLQYGRGDQPYDRQRVEELPAETLAAWARALGRYVPLNVAGDAQPLEFAPPEIAQVAEEYYAMRARTWDTRLYATQSAFFDIPEGERVYVAPQAVVDYVQERERRFGQGIWDAQDAYYSLPAGRQRRAYLEAHPELRAYWDFKHGWEEANPEAAAYLAGDAPITRSRRSLFLDEHPALLAAWQQDTAWLEAHPEARPYVKPGSAAPDGASEQGGAEGEGPAQAAADERRVVAAPGVETLVTGYLFAGRALPGTLRADLTRAWEARGRPAGSLEGWLYQVLAFGGDLNMPAGPAWQPPQATGIGQ